MKKKKNSSVLPSAPNSERALLGLAMHHPEFQERLIREIDDPSCFRVEGNRVLFSVIREIYESRMKKSSPPRKIGPRMLMMSDRFRDRVDDMGGARFLSMIWKFTDDPENFDYHLGVVRLRAMQRDLIGHHRSSLKNLKSYDGEDPEQILSMGENGALRIAEKYGRRYRGDPVTIGPGAVELLRKIHSKDRSVTPVFTGHEITDSILYGLWPGRAYVVIARPKVGKSSLLTDMAISIAIEGVERNDGPLPVAYIDTETTPDDFNVRVLSNLSGVDSNYILSNSFRESRNDKRAVRDALAKMQDSNLHWVREQFMSAERAVMEVKQMAWRYGIRAIFYDQIKISDENQLGSVKEYQAIGYLMTRLKDLAEELMVPLVAAAHTNREDTAAAIRLAKKGIPVDPTRVVADSDRIYRYCSVLLHLRSLSWIEVQANGGSEKGNTMLSVIGNRHGRVHNFLEGVTMNFHGDRCQFEEVEETSISLESMDEEEEDIL